MASPETLKPKAGNGLKEKTRRAQTLLPLGKNGSSASQSNAPRRSYLNLVEEVRDFVTEIASHEIVVSHKAAEVCACVSCKYDALQKKSFWETPKGNPLDEFIDKH